MTSCGMVCSLSEMVTMWLLATSPPLRMASATSPALPRPTPTRPRLSPTTTRALKLKRRPPLTTLADRLMKTTFSDNSALAFSSAVRNSVPPSVDPGRARRGPRPPMPPRGPPRPGPALPRLKSATVYLLVSLEFQSALARRVRQRLDLAMIARAGAVENHTLDALGLGRGGAQRSEALGARDVRLQFVAIRDRLGQGRGGGERHARRVVDELDVNVFVGETDGHAGTRLRSDHLAANAPAAQLSQLLFFLALHVLPAADGAAAINPNPITAPSCLPCG